MSRILHLLRYWHPVLLPLCLLFGASPSAVGAPLQPGTRITNQAEAFGFRPDEALEVNLLSNQVVVTIISNQGLTLEPDRRAYLFPGAQATFSHRITNTGNVSGTYTFQVSHPEGDTYDLGLTQLFLDANGNGLIDQGEPDLLAEGGAKLTLAAGSHADVILSGRVPPQLRAGDLSRVNVTAQIDGTAISATVTDEVVVGDDEVRLFKGVDRTTASIGEPIHFTLTAQNGSTALTPINITIDGQVRSRVVIRDEIPRNTTFQRVLASPGLQQLYHLRSAASDHEYVTSAPADLDNVEAIAFATSQVFAGQRLEASFAVIVKPLGSGGITNQAHLFHRRPESPTTDVPSNEVAVEIPIECPVITVYTDETFTLPTEIVSVGSPVFVEIEAGFLNVLPTVRDELPIHITSRQTGDVLDAIFIETGPNTGVFRRKLANEGDSYGFPTETSLEARPGDMILQTAPRDVLTAIIRNGCLDGVTQIQILIDPAGIVFDSRTGERVAGATVTLIDVTGRGNGGNAGGPAVVFKADGLTPSPSTIVTSGDGAFEFPRVGASTYQLLVTPPAQHAFPSQVPMQLMPTILNPSAEARILEGGSYGDVFEVNEMTGAVFLDVPVDTESPEGFVLEKSVNQREVEIGESVQYTLELKNTTGSNLPGTFIDDVLPAGVSYITGSARLNSQPMADPTGGKGPNLRFRLGNLPDQTTYTVTYRARVGMGADRGDGVNRARATSLGPPATSSNLALAEIEIDQGVFTDRGVIFGKVFVDLNDNRIHDGYIDPETGEERAEPVVPGVRIFLEDGTYAITDSEGKYSIYGQRAIHHVVKLDRYTLPTGAKLAVIDSLNAGDPDSRFADLRKGELHKANFRIVEPSDALLALIEQRRAAGDPNTAEIDRTLDRRFTYEDRLLLADPTSGPASGTVDQASSTPSFFQPVLPENTLTAANSNLPARPVAVVPHVSLEDDLANVSTNEPEILDLRDGDTVAVPQVRLRVKGRAATRLEVKVNGEVVPEERRGKYIEDTARDLQAAEYIAVQLAPGDNSIELTQYDFYGNERGSDAVTIRAPDGLAQLNIAFSNPEPAADGTTPVQVSVRLEDRHGTLVSAPTPLTLSTTLGEWQVQDVNPQEEGIQVFLTGGEGTYTLLPPGEPGLAEIVVSSGVIEKRQILPFLPDLRPLIASGILTGRINLNDRGASIVPAYGNHGFEEELRALSRSSDGDLTEGRAAFFLKGQIKGEWLLTTAYDSDKRSDVELFRDIDPDKYYPVYGDSSVKGFEAQSSGNLYVRVDNRRSYLLWGDFMTRTNNEARDLGNYNRSLNGFKGHYETDRAAANVFASHGNSRQVVVEIPANGTSGPYNFSASNGLINSEQVEIITRDRNQLSMVIERTPMTRYEDYEFEPFTGRVLFRRPVPTLDTNLNPRYIRITYEVEQAGPAFWTYGVDGQVKVTDRFEVGGSYVKDENPLEEYQLYSANTTVALTQNVFAIAEVAQSEDMLKGTGAAGRVELRAVGEETEGRIFYGRTEADFVNPGALLTAGRVEGGAEALHRLNRSTSLRGQAVYTEDAVTGGFRRGARADVIHRFDNQVELEGGVRVSEETELAASPLTRDIAPNEVRSLRGKFTAPVPYLPDARFFTELEQDVVEMDKQRFALGGDYQVSTRTRVYATHEIINSLGGEFEINESQRNYRTLAGVETEVMRDTQSFNEYRMRDAMEGRQAEASTGLRNQWQVADGLRLNTTFERITPFDGVDKKVSTSVTEAIEYTGADTWKATTRAEYRTSTDQDTFLGTIGYAAKLNRNWTFLGRTLYHTQDDKNEDTVNLKQTRYQGGLAWRQTDEDVWNALFLYEYRTEEGISYRDDLGTSRQVHIFSNTLNYQPNEDWIWTNRIAGKWVSESLAPFEDRYSAFQDNGRIIRKFDQRWDIGLNYAAMWTGDKDEVSYGFGPEIGFWARHQIRIGLGYNFWGYVDRDFDTSGETQRGFFLSLSMKFDEDDLPFRRKEEETY
ncbi:MAG: hypothetical protein Q7P63_07205 [Verrucomicrobiota bacterium JB022]|nr:hypothetical protein [Verrucomicrobiota bacterium JB022]